MQEFLERKKKARGYGSFKYKQMNNRKFPTVVMFYYFQITILIVIL